MKLFGNAGGGSRLAKNRGAAQAVRKRRNPLKPLAFVLAFLLLAEVLYFTAIFSNNSFISKWRTIYITTAMSTMRHQWLATCFIPEDVIQEVMEKRNAAITAADGLNSAWNKPEEPEAADPGLTEIDADITVIPVETEEERQARLREEFFELFYEVDRSSMDAYLDAHPEVLDNGWDQIDINEAGLDDDGTDIQTIYGEQVLAIDVPNQILLVREKGSGYRGILAIAKDPARLAIRPSSQIGEAGETVAQIASTNGGVLGMNAGAFNDEDGAGDGSELFGFARCDGVSYGYPCQGPGAKRLELHEDNLMYIMDAKNYVSANCTDAVEWFPALIVDGKDVLVPGYDGLQPRGCIGQSDKYEILMLVIEGRNWAQGIVGCPLADCVEIFLRHGCMQAMNLDGGASSIMWYKGETITICGNQRLQDGRTVPTAFVYGPEE